MAVERDADLVASTGRKQARRALFDTQSAVSRLPGPFVLTQFDRLTHRPPQHHDRLYSLDAQQSEPDLGHARDQEDIPSVALRAPNEPAVPRDIVQVVTGFRSHVVVLSWQCVGKVVSSTFSVVFQGGDGVRSLAWCDGQGR